MKKLLEEKPYYLKEEQIQGIYEILDQMTVEEKVNQLFCMIAYSDDDGLVEDYTTKGYGGLMCRPMEMDQVLRLKEKLVDKARIPFLIAANMEAGMDQVCSKGTYVGSQMSIASTQNSRYAYELGNIIGKEARVLGVNWAFAPVADIDYNWRNPITNIRTYGSDPDTVLAMATEYIRGLQKHGIASSVKHFPGDGVDERDQHLLTSVNSLSCDEWMESYGKIYKACITEGALTMMIGHIMQPAWSKKINPSLKDVDIQPATVSKELVTGLLRQELGFNGTIITDASSMAGLCGNMSRRDALPTSIAAGCDMILFTKNEAEDVKFVMDGYQKGIISENRLNEAVIRILALKASLGLFEEELDDYGIRYKLASEIVGSEEHQALAKEVADDSITLVKEEKGVLPLTPEKYRRILVYGKEGGLSDAHIGVEGKAAVFAELLRNQGFEVDLYKPKEGFEGILAPTTETTQNYDALIYVATLATKSNQTVVRIEWGQPMGVDCPVYTSELPTIFISLENPYHLVDVPRMKTYINTYGGSPIVLNQLIKKLLGRSEFKGHSPVDPFCGFWDARL